MFLISFAVASVFFCVICSTPAVAVQEAIILAQGEEDSIMHIALEEQQQQQQEVVGM